MKWLRFSSFFVGLNFFLLVFREMPLDPFKKCGWSVSNGLRGSKFFIANNSMNLVVY